MTVTDHSGDNSAITTETKKLRVVKGAKQAAHFGQVVEKGKVKRVTDEHGKSRLVRRIVVKKKKK